ncbi:hypothetical protein SEA_SUPERCHUNK_38 [Mycobacterium phage Superchunk]|nr:hypothetical protein SEA_SUPERCHUNK_38 [Mycobacterium phage Superchunk]
MQLGFITLKDPTEDGREVMVNVAQIEAILTDADGDTVLQMRSGRIHYTDQPRDAVWAALNQVASHFEEN